MKTAAVAGTFNILHDGHKALIHRAFEVGDKVLIGITSDRLASIGRDGSIPLEIRMSELSDFVKGLGKYEIFVIDDIYGQDYIMDNVDVLVVSEETLNNGNVLNDRRKRRGMDTMELSIVSLVMSDDGSSKISSSAIMRGEYGRHGDSSVIDVAVGSVNPAKVAASRAVMERVYGDVKITSIDVPSGVPVQPFGYQTYRGSLNRARLALQNHDMAIGIEAGVFEMLDGLYGIHYCTIIDHNKRETYGQGSGFKYPDSISKLVRSGMTVEDAMGKIYGNDEIDKRRGAISILSKGLLDRKSLAEQSIIAAMVPRI